MVVVYMCEAALFNIIVKSADSTVSILCAMWNIRNFIINN